MDEGIYLGIDVGGTLVKVSIFVKSWKSYEAPKGYIETLSISNEEF
jgi:pantothenate kinase